MDSVFAAFVLSVVLATAVILVFANPGRIRRRTALRILAFPPDVRGLEAGNSRHPVSVQTREPPAASGELRNVPMMLELVAAMLDSGASLGRALDLIAHCAAKQIGGPLRAVVSALDIGTDWETAWRSSAQQSVEASKLKDALTFAALTGAPSSAILYAQAARLRREQFRAAEKRAAALGVKLVVPLGLCSLPAFICLGVVPVLLAMLPHG